jgi:hypothetical protein
MRSKAAKSMQKNAKKACRILTLGENESIQLHCLTFLCWKAWKIYQNLDLFLLTIFS